MTYLIMMLCIMANDIKSLRKLLGYSPPTYTFDDMFTSFRKSVKNKNLQTEEIFSLSYDSLLSDLKQAIWVSIDEKDFPLINKQLKILEICN